VFTKRLLGTFQINEIFDVIVQFDLSNFWKLTIEGFRETLRNVSISGVVRVD